MSCYKSHNNKYVLKQENQKKSFLLPQEHVVQWLLHLSNYTTEAEQALRTLF